MSPEAQEIMRLANVLATRRVRLFAVTQATYRGNETEARCIAAVAEAKAALEAAVAALGGDLTQRECDPETGAYLRTP